VAVIVIFFGSLISLFSFIQPLASNNSINQPFLFIQTHIQANLFGMFRDEKLFPDNTSFKPERWLRENKMDTQLKSLSNLIWGHGARMCIGRRFAEQELHIALTKVCFRLLVTHCIDKGML